MECKCESLLHGHEPGCQFIAGPVGDEEGEVCNRDGCPGVLEFEKPENCSCHISPPCSSCTDVRLRCPECFWIYGDDE